MMDRFECGTCGVVSDHREDVCQPVALSGSACGVSPQRTENICAPMAEDTLVCGSCGRPATRPDLVCRPERRHGD